MSLSNSLGLLGRKVGMMRLFTEDGDAVPVTVVDVSNNRVAQVKTQANDGYDALQVAYGKRRASRVTKPKPATWPKPVSKPVKSFKNSA
jgi:large subunit ribosomal protein L3